VILTVQTLHQQNGFAITLLGAEVVDDDDDDDGIDDTVERLARPERLEQQLDRSGAIPVPPPDFPENRRTFSVRRL
jgi:hypothetical protein